MRSFNAYARFLDPAEPVVPCCRHDFMAALQSTLTDLRRIVGAENVLVEKEDPIPYSFDGTAALQQMPGAVVLAQTTEEVIAILLHANRNKITVVARGSREHGIKSCHLDNCFCIAANCSRKGRSREGRCHRTNDRAAPATPRAAAACNPLELLSRVCIAAFF
jgi:hypothetical protein